MRDAAEVRTLLWQAVVILLALVLLAAWAIHASRRPLRSDDVRLSAADLASFAAEGEVIGRQLARHRLPRMYVEEEIQFLADEVVSVRASLWQRKTPVALAAAVARVQEGAARTGAELHALSTLHGDGEAARGTAERLHAIADELHVLERVLSR